MKLLLDENLSRRLVPFLLHDYPGSSQVCLIGLESATDVEVWNTAKQQDFVIVTRDADFEELSLVWGAAAKGHLAKNQQPISVGNAQSSFGQSHKDQRSVVRHESGVRRNIQPINEWCAIYSGAAYAHSY